MLIDTVIVWLFLFLIDLVISGKNYPEKGVLLCKDLSSTISLLLDRLQAYS